MGGVFKASVRLIDHLLRVSQGIKEISEDPECILRIQLRWASYTVTIASETILRREPVLAIHAWNERMPVLLQTGPNLEWALQLRRQVVHSFRLVAQVMQSDSRYSQVCAVTGASALFSFTDHTGGVRLMQHLGFTVLPYHRPLGKFGEFWENLFSWWLMWTYNKASLKSRQFFRLQRTEIWMTASEFLRCYGHHLPR